MAASSATNVGDPYSYTNMDQGDVEAIGAHCQFGGCNQLDFLPFHCQSCQSTYCLDHRTETAHRCARAGAWARARTSPLNQSSAPTSIPSPNRLQPLPQACSHPACRTPINTPLHLGVHCPTCNRHYCLKHRLSEDHSCKSLTPLGGRPAASAGALNTSAAKAALSRFRAWGKEKQTTLLPKPKPTSSAARLVALNNLKKAARGDAELAVEKRIYLHVEASADTTTAKFPTGDFFYNRDWSVGRMLDEAAKKLGVQNVNNQGKGEAEKLRVFHVEGGRLLEFTERTGEVLMNGNTVVLLRGVGPSVPDLIAL